MTTWQNIRQEEPGEAFGPNGHNKIQYPSWWPTPAPYRGYQILEGVYGFPFLSYWSLERGGFPKCPKIDIENFRGPTEALLNTMPRLDELADLWAKASKPNANWVENIGRPLAEFWDSLPGQEHYKLWEPYLVENCLPQLQFFGVPFKSVPNKEIFNPATSGSLFFNEPLTYCPAKWTLMVVFTLMITITNQVKKNKTTPFILWDTGEVKGTIIHYINMPWFNDKSRFNFPILSWVKNKDESQITILSKKIRANNLRSRFWVEDVNEKSFNGWTREMSAFLCFIRAYNSSLFNQLTEREFYWIMNKGFKIIYVDMLERLNKNNSWKNAFKQIDGPGGVYSSPYSNLKSSVDWMVWSLMVMWVDLKKTNGPLASKIKDIPINEDHYQYIFTTQLNAFRSDTTIDKEIDEELDRQKNAPDTIWDPIQGRHINLPFQTKEKVFSDFTSNFQKEWRKTAEYHFMGIHSPKWPPQFPPLSFNDPNSLEAKMYEFMAVNPPRRLRVPAIDPINFQRLTNKWDSVFKQQYVYYMEWVYNNVKAQDNPHYSSPGIQLKDPKGDYISISNGGTSVPLINSFPDLLMVPPDTGFTLSKAVSFLIIPIDQAAKFIWGDDWTDFLDNLGQKMWVKIKESLQALWNVVKEQLPMVGGILLAAGVIFLGGLLGVTYLEEEVKKIA